MPDTPAGAHQPHNPTLIQRLTAQEAKEKAQRMAGVYRYGGPFFTWMGPRVCIQCDHTVSAHEHGQCFTINGAEGNNSDCPCTANLEEE